MSEVATQSNPVAEAEHSDGMKWYRLAFGVSLLIMAGASIAGFLQMWATGRFAPGLTVAPLIEGDYWVAQGRLDLAEKEFERATKVDPVNMPAFSRLGDVRGKLGNKPGAIEAYERARDLAPRDPRTYNNLALAYAANGMKEEAVSTYRAALKVDPDFLLARLNLAGLLGRLGSPEEAEKEFQTALEKAPDRSMTHLHYGAYLASNRRFAEAVESLEEAVRLDPESEQAQTFLKRATNDLQAARKSGVDSAGQGRN